MPIVMTTVAEERSTFVAQCTFKNETGSNVIPIDIVWTLADKFGNVINARSSVAIVGMTAIVNIVLTGTDLIVSETFPADVWRFLTVSATYDSTLGTGLKLRDSAKFQVANLTSIS